jgi:hypothetical protein
METMDAAELRRIEQEAIERIMQKARELRAQNPSLSPSIARAKAAESLPRTMDKYLGAVSHLQYMGHQPREWK